MPVSAAGEFTAAKWECGPTTQLQSALHNNGEDITAVGAVGDTILLTLWVNPKSKEWTIVVTTENQLDVSCIVLYGNKFSVLTAKLSI